MGLTSLQVCIDSTDWLQGTIHDEHGMDSSSSPSGDMLTCSRPLIERRLRPQHDQALKCPRCDSTHTKFCYYNNYSLSQPRYFCKTCRRYWTKGGTLRNIPVGGGCRKNKKVSKKASSDTPMSHSQNPGIGSSSSTDLHLSFPHEVQLSHLNSVLGVQGTITNPTFMESSKYNNMCGLIDQHPHRNVDFMETKLEAIMGSSSSSSRNNYDIMGSMNGELGVINNGLATNFHGGFCSPYGMSLDHGNYGNCGSGGAFIESCQRLMLPYDQGNCSHDNDTEVDVKPKLLSLDWHNDQDCLNNMGSWSGMMNGGGYGSSATNPLM